MVVSELELAQPRVEWVPKKSKLPIMQEVKKKLPKTFQPKSHPFCPIYLPIFAPPKAGKRGMGAKFYFVTLLIIPPLELFLFPGFLLLNGNNTDDLDGRD